MTAILHRPPSTGGCPLAWCMADSGCTTHEAGEGDLHFGRPSSVGTYDGDDLVVRPYRFDYACVGEASETTGSRVEVGADYCNRVTVPLTPPQASVFADAVYAAARRNATGEVTIEVDPDDPESRSVTISSDVETVRLRGFEYDLIRLTFRAPDESDGTTVVQVDAWDAAAFARYVKAAAEEVAQC